MPTITFAADAFSATMQGNTSPENWGDSWDTGLYSSGVPLPSQDMTGSGSWSALNDPIQLIFDGGTWTLTGGSGQLGRVLSSVWRVTYNCTKSGDAAHDTLQVQQNTPSNLNFAVSTNSGTTVNTDASSFFGNWINADANPQFTGDFQVFNSTPATSAGTLSVTANNFVVTYGRVSVHGLVPSSGPTIGGTVVTVTLDDIDSTGVDLLVQDPSDVEFGSGNFADTGTYTRLSNTSFSIETPAGMGDGPVDVIVTFAGIVPYTKTNGFNYGLVGFWYYNPETNQYQLTGSPPGAPWILATSGPGDPVIRIDKILPPQGAIAGGEEVTIVGEGFGDGATVTIGGVPLTGVVVHDQTMIKGTLDAFGGAIAGPEDLRLGADDPEHANETVQVDQSYEDVVVENLDSTNATLTDGFLYYDIIPIWWNVGPGLVGPLLYPPTVSPPLTPPVFATTPDDEGWWLSAPDSIAGAALIVDDIPRTPRKWSQLGPFVDSTNNFAGGYPGVSAMWKNRMVYGEGNYTQGSEFPPIHIFDGSFDREIATVPKTVANAFSKGPVSLFSANGIIYFSTFDSGTTHSDWSGRVFTLNIETGKVEQLGATFPNGHIPYALAWHLGRLWCGTHRGGTSSAVTGKIYYIRPGIDTDWTEDRDLTTDSARSCLSMFDFEGTLYVGASAAAGTYAKILARSPVDGTWSTSATATAASAAAAFNGFTYLVKYNGSAYAAYYNPAVTPDMKIYKLSSGTWSSVYSTTGSNAYPLVYFVNIRDENLFALSGGLGRDGKMLFAETGSDWTDLTSFLTQTSPNASIAPAGGVIFH